MNLRHVLEQSLFDNPDDLAAHAAYSDLLQGSADPIDKARGEFIQVQLALEEESLPEKERSRLQRREQELLVAHQREWLADLAAHLIDQQDIPAHLHDTWGYRFSFRRGWLDTIEAGDLRLAFSRTLAHAREALLLRKLVRGQDTDWPDEPVDDLPEGYEYAPLLPLIGAPCMANLRVLQLGDTEDDEEDRGRYRADICGETAHALVSGTPRLEELYLYAWDVDTDALFSLDTLHHLRVLLVYHMDHYPLDKLAVNPSLRKLTHLLIFPHALRPGDEPCLDLRSVQAIVRSPYLNNLTHLRLRMCTAGDEGVREIIQSGTLARLRMLDLRHGRISDEGAMLLARCPDVSNLELLDLPNNCISAGGLAELRKTGVNLREGCQRRSVGSYADEGEYLYEGDIE